MRRGVGGQGRALGDEAVGRQGRALGDEADDDAPMREDERAPAARLFDRGNQIEIGAARTSSSTQSYFTCPFDFSARSE